MVLLYKNHYQYSLENTGWKNSHLLGEYWYIVVADSFTAVNLEIRNLLAEFM